MTKCSKCGKESMSFTCRYCGKKYCSEHRLPENHDCEDLEDGIEQEKEETKKWFVEKDVKEDLKPKKPRQAQSSTLADIGRTLKTNYTLSLIGFTSFFFLIQILIGDGATSSRFYNLLILQPGIENVLSQPWTIVTVMFLHAGLFHLFANMITLFFFGRPVERVVGGKEFLKFYFGSGIAASLGFIVFRNLLAVTQGSTVLGPAVGASGAVVATFAVVAMLYPKAEVLLYFFIPMKIKTALYLFAGIEGFNLLAKAAGIYLPVIGGFASSAHLTGLLVGVWYGKKLRENYSSKAGVVDLLGY